MNQGVGQSVHPPERFPVFGLIRGARQDELLQPQQTVLKLLPGQGITTLRLVGRQGFMLEPECGDVGPARIGIHLDRRRVEFGAFPSVDQGAVGVLGQEHRMLGVEPFFNRPLPDLGIEVGVQFLEAHTAVGIA